MDAAYTSQRCPLRGCGQVAIKNHLPSRNTRSASPRRCSPKVFRSCGEAANVMFFIRPRMVQIETVRRS
ncbi:hypothetical protein [Saccharopolyspora endophytica]|uniref:hypothetical protein n=1 Tax=Saccharopolyspora endophytica TaxID=543886 RepID=UPI003FD80D1B